MHDNNGFRQLESLTRHEGNGVHDELERIHEQQGGKPPLRSVFQWWQVLLCALLVMCLFVLMLAWSLR